MFQWPNTNISNKNPTKLTTFSRDWRSDGLFFDLVGLLGELDSSICQKTKWMQVNDTNTEKISSKKIYLEHFNLHAPVEESLFDADKTSYFFH